MGVARGAVFKEIGMDDRQPRCWMLSHELIHGHIPTSAVKHDSQEESSSPIILRTTIYAWHTSHPSMIMDKDPLPPSTHTPQSNSHASIYPVHHPVHADLHA
jgi:hypothetical protein